MRHLSTNIALAAFLVFLTSGPASAGLELATPTYTGVAVGVGDDYLVLDTDFNGRRLVVVDPDTVVVEPIEPLARLRVELRMGGDNRPHARFVAPAPEPSLLPAPTERSTTPAEPTPGRTNQLAQAPASSRPEGRSTPLLTFAAALAPLAALVGLRR